MHRLGHRGPSHAARLRGAAAGLLLAHLSVVCWLTLRPRDVPWVAPDNLVPLATIRAQLAGPLSESLPTLGGHLLLLAPFGVLFPLATGALNRSVVSGAAGTVSAGAVLTTALMALRTGVPGQVADIDAVLLQTLGALLAYLLVYLPLRSRLGGGTPAAPAAPAPRAGRRGPTLASARVGIAPQRDASPTRAALP